MRLRDWLLPKNEIFFDLLERHAGNVCKASDIFYKAIISRRFGPVTVKKIKTLESECDQLVREIFTNLNKTFITPIDHEDIAKLIITCDDLIDLIFEISRKINLYGIDGNNKTLREFVKITKEMIDEITLLVTKSAKLKQKPLFKHSLRIHQLENKADDLLIKSLENVFKLKNIKRLIMEKEVYELMEILTDRIEDFCDRVQGIVTKNL